MMLEVKNIQHEEPEQVDPSGDQGRWQKPGKANFQSFPIRGTENLEDTHLHNQF